MTERQRGRSWVPALILVAAAGLLLAAGAVLSPFGNRAAQSDAPQIGGPFALQDGNGRTITDKDFRGKWMLVYFGYTHCPDACPTALSDIATALDQLGTGKENIVPVFITVDPARDTPKVMHDYVSAFDAPFVALSGTDAAIQQAEKSYRVYAAKQPEKNGDYEMDHSSIIYVMDPQGHFVTNFTEESDPKDIAAKLKDLGA